jgi:hypothetical protein
MASGSFDVVGVAARALRDRAASRPVAPVKTKARRVIMGWSSNQVAHGVYNQNAAPG